VYETRQIVEKPGIEGQGYLKVLKEERKEPFFARMSKKLMISESEE